MLFTRPLTVSSDRLNRIILHTCNGNDWRTEAQRTCRLLRTLTLPPTVISQITCTSFITHCTRADPIIYEPRLALDDGKKIKYIINEYTRYYVYQNPKTSSHGRPRRALRNIVIDVQLQSRDTHRISLIRIDNTSGISYSEVNECPSRRTVGRNNNNNL